MLETRGFNHIDLATRDMEATRAFYEDVLGFPLVRADLVEIGDDGLLRHYFFDIGGGQLIGFMSGQDVKGYLKDFDTSINGGLGLARGVYHFAFDADSEDDLHRIKQHLSDKGVKVRGPVDHEGWSKSIYFQDPNGLVLEVCHLTRRFEADDAIPRVRFRREGRHKLSPSGSPPGGHAVYLDAGRLLPHIPAAQYPAQVLACALYLEGGVRGVEIGSVMFGKPQPDGTETPAALELVRLAIPRRTYTQSHIDYVGEVIATVAARADALTGLRIVEQPPWLRHFTAAFAPV